MINSKILYFAPDFVFSKRDNQIILTSLNNLDHKIYTFEGPCAQLIELLVPIKFIEDDFAQFSKKIKGNFTIDEWKFFLKFCLDEKIFLQS